MKTYSETYIPTLTFTWWCKIFWPGSEFISEQISPQDVRMTTMYPTHRPRHQHQVCENSTCQCLSS
uniref:SFRICE_006291 n=1 Tax=Spodoptera frugiperda TaxID=7108 RepID=A0A2H1VV35_SPOFR